MLITRTSKISGETRTLEMPVTQEQLDSWYNGELIQKAMPNLTDAQREFIKSGIIDEEWDEMFDA
jgi:hypothetical protein